jgi:hypothetical protein
VVGAPEAEVARESAGFGPSSDISWPGGSRPKFAILKAGRYQAGSILPQGCVGDLAPTMLELLGAPVPDYLEGIPLTSELGRRLRASEAIE